jgi:TPR repeat protein
MTQLHWRTCLHMPILVALTSMLMACTDYQNARSAYAAGDYTKAYQLFQALAESGDTKAQYDLSLMYIQGMVLKKILSKAWSG